MNEELLSKTLDDMVAGIPARDAEIAALRAERDQQREALNQIASIIHDTSAVQSTGEVS